MTERDIFSRALQIESNEERSAYLESACRGDTALRQRLESLLAQEADLGSFLAGAAGLELTRSLPGVTEQAGDQIGPFKLLQPIGEGGMGVVYMAEQTEPVERRVALKIIKPGMDTQQVIARFEAERQALALMDHPNIAKVLDAGTTATGRPYFVMELVKGIPITTYCDREHLSVRERLELFLPVCQAIQHAHQKGIIHRDVKPTNILVARYDGEPIPKVIDFGVAKATSQRLTERTMFTKYGQIVGTVEYMSPEQAEFNQLDVDTRSDIYSLGVLLYELLTGETPFDKQRLRSVAFDELLRIIRDEEPPRPSTKLSGSHSLPSAAVNRRIEPRKLSLLMRRELDWIVMKSLDKDRNRRYETATGLAADVRHYLNDEAVVACPPSLGYRFRKLARRHRRVIGTTAAIVAVLIAGIAGTAWQAIQATRQRDRAVKAEELAQQRLQVVETQNTQISTEADRAREAEQRAKDESATADAINRFLLYDLLAQAIPDNEADRDVTLRTVLDRAAEKIPSRFTNQPVVEAGIRRMVGLAYLMLGEYQKAESHLLRSLEIHRKHLGNEHRDTLIAINNLAVLYRNLGDIEQAEKLLVEVFEARRRVLGPNHRETLSAMNNLAMVYQIRGKLGESESLVTEALEAQRRLLGPDHADTLTSMNTLAGILKKRREFQAAESLVAETLAIRERTLGRDHPRTLISMNNLASLFEAQGKFTEAEALFVKTLSLRKRVLGGDHPQTLVTIGQLAKLYGAFGRRAEANALVDEFLTAARTSRSAGGVSLADALSEAGHIKLQLGYCGGAERILRESVGIYALQRPGSWQACEARSRLGAALAGLERYSEAEPLLVESVETMMRQSHPSAERQSLLEGLRLVVAFYEYRSSEGDGERAESYRSLLESQLCETAHGGEASSGILRD